MVILQHVGHSNKEQPVKRQQIDLDLEGIYNITKTSIDFELDSADTIIK